MDTLCLLSLAEKDIMDASSRRAHDGRRRAVPGSCERHRPLWAGEQRASPSSMSAADCSSFRVMAAGRATAGATPWPPYRQVTPRSWNVSSVSKLFECLAFLFPKQARLNFCQRGRSPASIIGQEDCGGFCFCENLSVLSFTTSMFLYTKHS